MFLPERKNSLAFLPAVLEANTPINMEITKNEIIIAQSRIEIFMVTYLWYVFSTNDDEVIIYISQVRRKFF